MPLNNPVQVVLNSEQFIEAVPTVKHPVSHRDFYKDNNEEFVEHKYAIINSLSSIKMNLEQSDLPVCYAKIKMREDAIAKSYKPTSIFMPSRDDWEIPFVGGGEVGEIYIELTPERIARSSAVIRTKAEESLVRFNERTEEFEVSAVRSEVGAIDNITEYVSDDKRAFSTEQAISYLQSIGSATYIVKLFRPFPSLAKLSTMSSSQQFLFTSFRDGIVQIAPGIIVKYVDMPSSKIGTVEITVTKPGISGNQDYNYDFDIHDRILNFLSFHPLVRKITMPAKLQLIRSGFVGTDGFAVPHCNRDRSYPVLGIIDGGISDFLSDWIIHRYDKTQTSSNEDIKHGTFIAGLAAFGQSLNSVRNCPEYDGCLLADINIFTNDNRTITSELLDELELAIYDAKIKTNGKLRIFNFSMNLSNSKSDNYDELTQRLDKIAEEYGVIIVISAGNIDTSPLRDEWSDNVPVNISNLNSYSGDDRITSPAMSIRNISVGAVNPVDDSCISSVSLAPTNYTRRGIASKIILKPDLAYVGGRGTNKDTGLTSIEPNGFKITGCGTSYATPLVARILASLDNEIIGGEQISRETLIALLIHSAQIPECMSDKAYKIIRQDFIGFGIPSSCREILNNDDHEIRLVFNSILLEKKRMVFDFDYPASLVNENGGVKGEMLLTLVATPPLDDSFEIERVRINVKAQVAQYDSSESEKTGKPKYKGILKPFFASDSDVDLREKNLINVGLKWGTTKKYKFESRQGVGKSSSMRLVVDYESRENTIFPRDGIPFSVILTIRDPEGEKPIFYEMQNQLQNNGVTIANIQIATHVQV